MLVKDRINPEVKGLQFGTMLVEAIKGFRDNHPEKDFTNYPIISHANNWVQVRSIMVCNYIELHTQYRLDQDGHNMKGQVTILDADHGDEYAPPNNSINVADPQLLDRLNEWFRYIWGVYS